MGKPLILAFYITVCFIAFITSKIIIAILLYKRWRRKHKVFKDSLSGNLHYSPHGAFIYLAYMELEMKLVHPMQFESMWITWN